MNATFARGVGLTHVVPTHPESPRGGIAHYLAALLSGFAVGAGLGVLLWHLF